MLKNLRLVKVFALLFLIINYSTVYAQSSCPKQEQEQPLVIYTTSWCPYCKQTKDYLEGLGISFTEYDIETCQIGKQKYDAINGKGIPIVTLGNFRLDGYNQALLEQALIENGLLNKSSHFS